MNVVTANLSINVCSKSRILRDSNILARKNKSICDFFDIATISTYHEPKLLGTVSESVDSYFPRYGEKSIFWGSNLGGVMYAAITRQRCGELKRAICRLIEDSLVIVHGQFQFSSLRGFIFITKTIQFFENFSGDFCSFLSF